MAGGLSGPVHRQVTRDWWFLLLWRHNFGLTNAAWTEKEKRGGGARAAPGVTQPAAILDTYDVHGAQRAAPYAVETQEHPILWGPGLNSSCLPASAHRVHVPLFMQICSQDAGARVQPKTCRGQGSPT